MAGGACKVPGPVRDWQAKNLAELTAPTLLAGVQEIFAETARYYTAVQSGPIRLP